jgi:hypothetical protein
MVRFAFSITLHSFDGVAGMSVFRTMTSSINWEEEEGGCTGAGQHTIQILERCTRGEPELRCIHRLGLRYGYKPAVYVLLQPCLK